MEALFRSIPFLITVFIVLGAIFFGVMYYNMRIYFEYIQERKKRDYERKMRREQQERDWKLWKYQIMKTVHQAEEWEVAEVKELKDAVELLEGSRTMTQIRDSLRMRTFFPVPIVSICAHLSIFFMLGGSSAILWGTVFLVSLLLLSFVWSGYHGYRWYRASHLLRQIDLLLDASLGKVGESVIASS